LKALSDKIFESKFDKILFRIPALGKLFSSIFGLSELYILEFFRRIDNKFNIYTMGIFNKYILKGRWGGKVVPLNRNIDADTKFLPTEEIIEIVKGSKVTGIAWCYCRAVQRKYNEPHCDNPIFTCIHLSFGTSLYEVPNKSERLKEVSKEEIYKLLEESDKRGLIHQLIYFPSPQFYYIICNCCPCCCVVMNKFLKNGSPQMIKSEFIATTDYEICINCGDCEKWCYFGARKIEGNILNFNSIKCFGCGICISKCHENAIILTKKL